MELGGDIIIWPLISRERFRLELEVQAGTSSYLALYVYECRWYVEVPASRMNKWMRTYPLWRTYGAPRIFCYCCWCCTHLGRLLCKIFRGSKMDPFCPFCVCLHSWTSLYECRILCSALCKNKHFTFFVLYGDHTYHVSYDTRYRYHVPGTRYL